jgi:hypothetical protein
LQLVRKAWRLKFRNANAKGDWHLTSTVPFNECLKDLKGKKTPFPSIILSVRMLKSNELAPRKKTTAMMLCDGF